MALMTSEQLSEFSKNHLCYEIDSLFAALGLFAQQEKLDAKDLTDAFRMAAANLFLEGVILHSRCLFEFLYKTSNVKYPDDALAIHYFDDTTMWPKLRPSAPETLATLSRRTGKEVAHLTYSRMAVTEIKKHWDLYSITNDLLTILDLFANNASKHKIHPDVAKTINFWKRLHMHEPHQTSLVVGSSSPSIGATMPINKR